MRGGCGASGDSGHDMGTGFEAEEEDRYANMEEADPSTKHNSKHIVDLGASTKVIGNEICSCWLRQRWYPSFHSSSRRLGSSEPAPKTLSKEDQDGTSLALRS